MSLISNATRHAINHEAHAVYQVHLYSTEEKKITIEVVQQPQISTDSPDSQHIRAQESKARISKISQTKQQQELPNHPTAQATRHDKRDEPEPHKALNVLTFPQINDVWRLHWMRLCVPKM